MNNSMLKYSDILTETEGLAPVVPLRGAALYPRAATGVRPFFSGG